MAILALDGFEIANTTVFGGTGASYNSTDPRSGLLSLNVLPSSGQSSYAFPVNPALPTAATAPYARIYLRPATLPSTTARGVLGFVGSSDNIRLNPSGTLALFSDAGTLIGTSTTALVTGRWYCIEYRRGAATATTLLKIDGAVEITGTQAAGISDFFGGTDTVADAYIAGFDDFAVASGGFPGAGKVVLLLPISDNARGAKWFAGTATTTNLFAAVDNLPPAGKVSTQTTTSAITHQGTGVNPEDYDANMTSYTTAGIGVGATINAVQAFIIHAEDIATGTKLLTFSVKSNPAQGAFETNFSAGNDVGAAGAWPTNWPIKFGTAISAPSVTLGTSPVLSVRRPETASRAADVCFMGIYVDYTPAVVTIPNKQRIVMQAVQRASSW